MAGALLTMQNVLFENESDFCQIAHNTCWKAPIFQLRNKGHFGRYGSSMQYIFLVDPWCRTDHSSNRRRVCAYHRWPILFRGRKYIVGSVGWGRLWWRYPPRSHICIQIPARCSTRCPDRPLFWHDRVFRYGHRVSCREPDIVHKSVGNVDR